MAHQVQDHAAARSLGLLHEGIKAVMKVTAQEFQGLLKAAKEGDEKAQAVLYELVAHVCTIQVVAMIVAWSLLAMVTVRYIFSPQSRLRA
jgi:dihydrodipicolinate synthase/N-acetylneuraminate lyase